MLRSAVIPTGAERREAEAAPATCFVDGDQD